MVCLSSCEVLSWPVGLLEEKQLASWCFCLVILEILLGTPPFHSIVKAWKPKAIRVHPLHEWVIDGPLKCTDAKWPGNSTQTLCAAVAIPCCARPGGAPGTWSSIEHGRKAKNSNEALQCYKFKDPILLVLSPLQSNYSVTMVRNRQIDSRLITLCGPTESFQKSVNKNAWHSKRLVGSESLHMESDWPIHHQSSHTTGLKTWKIPHIQRRIPPWFLIGKSFEWCQTWRPNCKPVYFVCLVRTGMSHIVPL